MKARSLFQDFIRTAALITASVGSLGAFVQDNTPENQSSTQSATKPPLPILPGALERFGDYSVHKFFHDAHLNIHKHSLGISDEAWRNLTKEMNDSKLFEKAMHKVTVAEMIQSLQGKRPLYVAAEELLSSTARKMMKKDFTLEQASTDPLMKAYILATAIQVATIDIKEDNGLNNDIRRSVKLSDILEIDGTIPDKRSSTWSRGRDIIDSSAVKSIRYRPLSDLWTPQLMAITDRLKESVHDPFFSSLKGPDRLVVSGYLRDQPEVVWRVLKATNHHFYIGDILEGDYPEHLVVNDPKRKQVATDIEKIVSSYVQNSISDAKKRNESLYNLISYDYTRYPLDDTGAVMAFFVEKDDFIYLLRLRLVTELAEDKYPISTERHAFESLKNLSINESLNPDGTFNHAKIRDTLLQSIADKTLADVDVSFLEVFSDELAAVRKGLEYERNSYLAPQLKQTKLGDLITHGDNQEFQRREKTIGQLYPIEERVFDAVRYQGEKGEFNPWHPPITLHPFTQPPPLVSVSSEQRPPLSTGITSAFPFDVSEPRKIIIPYSYDINPKDNKLLSDTEPLSTTDVVPFKYTTDVHALTSRQQARSDYVFWKLLLGTCGVAQKYNGALPLTPDSDGNMIPWGVVLYNANLNKVPLNGSITETGAAGVSVDALLPSGRMRVDIAFHDPGSTTANTSSSPAKPQQTYAMDWMTNIHEKLHTLAGEDHEFTPIKYIPGVVDSDGSHYVPYLGGPNDKPVVLHVTTDLNRTSYTAGSYDEPRSGTELDVRVARSALGTCPVDYSASPTHTITVKIDRNDGTIERDRNPLQVWASETGIIDQTIITPPDATLDVSQIDGKAVRLESPLDLSRKSFDLLFSDNPTNPNYKNAHVVLVDNLIHKARVTSGDIVGASGDNDLTIEETGYLQAGNGGQNILRGGVGKTYFDGSSEGKTTFIVRSNKPSTIRDEIVFYKTGDVIVSPEKTDSARYQLLPPSSENDKYHNIGLITFLKSNNVLKSVLVISADSDPLEAKDLTVIDTGQKPVTLITEPEPPPKHTPRQKAHVHRPK